MDSSGKEIEKEQLNDYYVENTVFVAVGKQVKESESVLLWAAKKFSGKKRICILHIHQPAPLVTFFNGRFTTSNLKQRVVKALRESDTQKLHKLVNQYVLLLSQNGVRADRMWIEMDNVEGGIVNMIVQHGIKWLVMGAAEDKYFTKEMAELKSQKAIFVCEAAPASCHIWFTCSGNLIYTREGRRNNPSLDHLWASEVLESNVSSRESRLDAPSADDLREPNVLYSSLGTEAAENSRLSHPCDSDVVAEEVEDYTRGKDSDAGAISLDSGVATNESEQSLDSSVVTEEAESETAGSSDAEGFLSDSDVASEESEHLRLDCMIDEQMSPPRLTFRERGSILRACSVDLSSHKDKHLVLFSQQNNRRTSSGCISADEGKCEFEGKKQNANLRSSFNSSLLDGKRAGKAKLGTPRENRAKLERGILDAENLKRIACQETVKRWKAEEDAVDAKNKAEVAKGKYAKEVRQRKELEKAVQKQKLECVKFKDEHENCRRELPMVKDQCCDLEKQIRESELTVKELEEKIISAVGLLVSFRNKRDQLQLERDQAVHEMETMRRLKGQRTTILSGPQFSTFSLMEIGEATCSFDPSKRIGDGKYGSIYHGILRHIEVAIRMLPNDGSQGQWRFEHEVEILSRVRHPNIVILIGMCTEARSVVYEYLEKGSLEDHFTCKGKTVPLNWQTRVRIATELCSALIFLHTNNPPIYHGNLKPTKILLDANFVSKIGDLGISHLLPQSQYLASKNFYYQNSIQDHSLLYMDPEFLETGVLTPDSDVYSFGVILLCLLTGSPASGIVEHVKCALDNDNLHSILDMSAGDWSIYHAKILAQLALWCCERERSNRADLASDVWSVLESLRKSCDAQAPCSGKKENRRPPSHFLCPIYQELMKDPCIAADGFTYEGDAIRGWLDSGHKTSPMTNLKLFNCDLIPNHALQYAIQEWLQRA